MMIGINLNRFDVYDEFCRAWLLECRRLLADDGTLWVIGSYHNIGRLARLMQDIGYWLLNDVIWKKSNPMPNFRGVRFTNATETLLWAKKSEKAKYTFNHQQMKAENGGKQMTSVWGISAMRRQRGGCGILTATNYIPRKNRKRF